ncbi:MAG: Ig-like domain-containing protein [Planctomycetota bacterium]|nr:Ig-like domain-containing protein [Planctomycetota bacterium]
MTIGKNRRGSLRGKGKQLLRKLKQARSPDASRQLFLESLEDRRLLAVGPQLIGIQPNDGELLPFDNPNYIRDTAPRELLFNFDENQIFNPSDLSGIQITRANLDHDFTPANVTTNFGLLDSSGNDVVLVKFFATKLGDAHNDIKLVFSKRDLGNGALPSISVVDKRVDVSLNTNVNNQTTVADLVAAFDEPANVAVKSLIRIEVVAGDPTLNIANLNTGGYSPLITSGANDIVIEPGFIGRANTDFNDIIVRFAETIPDDLYQIDVFGEGNNALRNIGGTAFGDLTADGIDNGVDQSIQFELDLAPLVTSVVPQPVVRDANGNLVQHRNQIVVYFSDDDLTPASAENTNFYQLIYTGQGANPAGSATGETLHPTATNVDDVVIFPETAVYNPEIDAVLLTFAENIDNPVRASGTYRLRVGTSEYRPLAPETTAILNDPGSTFTGTDENGVLTVGDLSFWDTGSTMVVLGDGTVFTAGETIAIAEDSSEIIHTFEFVDLGSGGVATGDNIAIDFNSAMSKTQIQTSIINAIDGEGILTASASSSAGGQMTIAIGGDRSIVLDSNLRGVSLANQAVIIQQEIVPSDNARERYLLDFPGSLDEPGHRDVNLDSANHVDGKDQQTGINTFEYNFRSLIGSIPGENAGIQPSYNDITEEQKSRAREVFELISHHSGVQFVETVDEGLIVATGDLRTFGCSAIACFTPPWRISAALGVRGFYGEGGNGAIINGISQPMVMMDNLENWNDELYGDWFRIAFHEIQHALDLTHSYDLPAIMGNPNTPVIEEQYPSNQDIVHLQQLMRPESIDIDMYEFEVSEAGLFTAETMAERMIDIADKEQVLDTSLNLYQVRVETDDNTGLPELIDGKLVPILDSNGSEVKDLIAYNDDYFSNDSYIELQLRPGKYYIGVSASGNSAYDPMVENSGIGGLSQGDYELRLNHQPFNSSGIVDADNPLDATKPLIVETKLDGDADGNPGGVYNFWFEAAAPSDEFVGMLASDPRFDDPRTIYVDKSAAPNGDGTLASPFNKIHDALGVSVTGQPLPFGNPDAVQPGRGDILRILPNTGLDGDIRTELDNLAYNLGFNSLGEVLSDGPAFQIPRDVTVMVDAGAIFKMRRSWIAAGSVSNSPLLDHSAGALQVLGTPSFVDPGGNLVPLGADLNPGLFRFDPNIQDVSVAATGSTALDEEFLSIGSTHFELDRKDWSDVTVTADGTTALDEEYLSIGSTNFEVDRKDVFDVTVTASGGDLHSGSIPDGEYLSIGSTNFELDPDDNGVAAGHIPVLVNPVATNIEVAAAFKAAIDGEALEGVTTTLDGAVLTIIQTAVVPVTDHDSTGSGAATGFSAVATSNGVGTPGNIPVTVDLEDTDADIAAAFKAAIDGEALAGVTTTAVGAVVTIMQTDAVPITDHDSAGSGTATGFSAVAISNGVGTPGNIPVTVDLEDTDADIAAAFKAAIDGASIPGVQTTLNGAAITITRANGELLSDNGATGFSVLDRFVEPLAEGTSGEAGNEGSVHFTSYNDESLGLDEYSFVTTPDRGDWGGIILSRDIDRADQSRFDYERQGIFLDYFNHADIAYGGGEVLLESVAQIIDPITMVSARPSISYNDITNSRDAAIGATPDSFEETNFHAPVYQEQAPIPFTYDYDRIGPDIYANYIVDNTINGLFIRITTPATEKLEKLTVAGRMNDKDIVHVLQENLIVETTVGGPFKETVELSLDLVTGTPLQLPDGNLPIGTVSYRMVFVDSDGFESIPTTTTAPFTTTGSQNALRLAQLHVAPDDFVARRIYRSTGDPVNGPWELIAQINQSDKEYIDDGTTIGGLLEESDFRLRPKLDARLIVDPLVIMKFDSSRIEIEVSGQFIAEATDGMEAVFTSILDDRYGFGGTFDTTDDGPIAAAPGNWGGLYAHPGSSISLDHTKWAFGGSVNRIEGDFAGFNVVEIHQADARITNSVFEFNANGRAPQGPANRFGRGVNAPSVIFVRNSQPVILDNLIYENAGVDGSTNAAAININANAMTNRLVTDRGRSTGFADALPGYEDNFGPLIIGNRLQRNDINGVLVRGETLTTQGVWDDHSITHVLLDQIVVDDFHTYGGLRLQSSGDSSLVVKLFGDNAGFHATGDPLEIDDRIGGAIQIVGQPKSPVVLTSLLDDLNGAGVQTDGDPMVDTNNDGDWTDPFDPRSGTAARPQPGDWGTVLFDRYAHDANVEVVIGSEYRHATYPGPNAFATSAEYLGSLAVNEKSGDENRHLGFEVHGLINHPEDLDVYSFEADAGTVVWIDLDQTTHSLDAVVELIDGTGNVLARSVNFVDEKNTDAVLFTSTGLATPPSILSRLTDGTGGGDFWATNPRDPAMRLQLPGPVGTTRTYHLRVRSNTAPDRIHLLDAGISSGSYQMSIRLRETETKPGTTVRYANIAFADVGVTVLGQPIHTPLGGEKIELPGNVVTPIGNVLEVDRGSTSIAGFIATAGETDTYQFEVIGRDLRNAQIDDPPSDGDEYLYTFDLDWADGLARADMTVYVEPIDNDGDPATPPDFGDRGAISCYGGNSTHPEDLALPNIENKVADLSRGSVGVLDPYLEKCALQEGWTYQVTVMSDALLPEGFRQFTDRNPVNPLFRVEPPEHLNRIVEDRLEQHELTVAERAEVTNLFFDPAGDRSFEPDAEILRDVDWDLSDLTLFIQTNEYAGGNVHTIDPFTGVPEVVNIFAMPGGRGFNDIEVVNGKLRSFSTDAAMGNPCLPIDAGTGVYYEFDSETRQGTTGQSRVVAIGDDGIATHNGPMDDNADVELQAECTSRDPDEDEKGVGYNMDAMMFLDDGFVYTVGRRGDGPDSFSGYRPWESPSNHHPHHADPDNGSGGPFDEWIRNIVFRHDPNSGAAVSSNVPRGYDARRNHAHTSHWPLTRIDLSAYDDPAVATGPDTTEVEFNEEGGPIAAPVHIVTGLENLIRNPENRLEDELYAVDDRGHIYQLEPSRPFLGQTISEMPNPTSTNREPHNILEPVSLRAGHDGQTKVWLREADGTGGFTKNEFIGPGGDPLLQFQGLTAIPDNLALEGGRYEHLLFAITNNGQVVAINVENPEDEDSFGELMRVFQDNAWFLDSGIAPGRAGFRGLAFDDNIENPWTTTTDKGDDLGHGIPGSAGGVSLQFSPNNAPGTLTGFVGGAHGTVISNEFSLRDISESNVPNLYFNYFTENTTTVTPPIPGVAGTVADSFRVYISDNSGQWNLLTTNISGGEPARQETFDSTGTWRQVRASLGEFAGADHLRLRFEFSTGGFSGYDDVNGTELYGIDGSYLRDGDVFQLDSPGRDRFDALVNSFEFESGFTIVSPAGGMIPDGSQVTIDHSSAGSETFTFVRDPALDGGNTIYIHENDDAADVVQKLASRLPVDPLTGEQIRHHLNGERLNFEAVKIDNRRDLTPDYDLAVELDIPGVTAVTAPAITGLFPGFIEGGDGVGADNVPVWVHEGMTRVEVAEAIHHDLEDIYVWNVTDEAYLEEVVLGNVAEPDSFKIWNDMVPLVGIDILELPFLGHQQGPLGYHQGPLPGDNGPINTDVLTPEGSLTDNRRFWANSTAGVFIDDIVIGMAGRGELVSGSTSNSNFVTNPNANPSGIEEGTYQLEIRPEEGFRNANGIPIRSWDFNDRLADGPSLVLSSGAFIHDGEYFDISNGFTTLRFEFDDIQCVGLDCEGVASGNLPISYHSEMEDWEIARLVRDAINRPEIESELGAFATFAAVAGQAGIDLTNNDGFPDLRNLELPGHILYSPTTSSNVLNLFGEVYIAANPSSDSVPQPELVGEFNDTILTATPTKITGNRTSFIANGMIGDNPYWSNQSSTDVDLFQVQIAGGETLFVDLRAYSLSSELDAVLRVFNADGVELARVDDTPATPVPNQNDPFLSFTPVDPLSSRQVYYVGVSSAPDNLGKHLPGYDPVTFDTYPLYDPESDTAREVGRYQRNPVGDLLYEKVGHYQIAFTVGVDGKTFDSVVDQKNFTYHNFNYDPAPVAIGANPIQWTVVPPLNPFVGYQGDTSHATGEEVPGEIGGRFIENLPLIYADTEISGLTIKSNISARGRLDHTSWDPGFEAPLLFGHFNRDGDISLGISLENDEATDKLAWRARLGDEFGTLHPLETNVGVDWSYTYVPSGGLEGFGELTVNVDGQIDSVEIPSSVVFDDLEAVSINSFGFRQEQTDPPLGFLDLDAAEIFVDEVFYTGTPYDSNGGGNGRNLFREQGQVNITSSQISDSADWGILSDDGGRDPAEGNHTHPGPVRNIDELNYGRLVPGVSIINNVLFNNQGGGIRYSGSAGAGPLGSVPHGRIVNNTIYGTRLEDDQLETGILVNEEASPTLLNNIIVNLEDGIIVAPDSDTTVVSGTVYHGNNNNSNVVNETFVADYSPTAGSACPTLFVNATRPSRNFYLCGGDGVNVNPAIDSAIASLEDRYDYVLVKDPIGISRSPVIAPPLDIRGQLRIDDPNTEPIGGIGENVFIDRGALDRSDFAGPRSELIVPFDNDPLGVDLNDALTYVKVGANEIVSSFEIRLNDGGEPGDPHEGIGIWDQTVTTEKVIVKQDGQLLKDGIDYSFSYNVTNDTIRLTPLSGIWTPSRIYTVELSNAHHWKLVTQPGISILDQDAFFVTDEFGVTVDFEFDRGFSMEVPQTLQMHIPPEAAGLGGITDGQTFTIRQGTAIPELFEFDLVGSAAPLLGRIPIPFTLNDGVDTIAQEVVDVLNNNINLDIYPKYLGDGAIHLGTKGIHVLNTGSAPSLATSGVAGGIADGEFFWVDDSNRRVFFEFEDQISPNGLTTANLASGDVQIDYSAADTNDEIAVKIETALRGANIGLDNATALDDGLPCFVLDGNVTSIPLGNDACVYVGGEVNHQLDASASVLLVTGEPGVRPEFGLKVPTVAGQLDPIISDGETFTIGYGPTFSVTFELNDTGGSNPNYNVANTPVNFNSTTTVTQFMNEIVVAIRSESLELDPKIVPGTTLIDIGSSTVHTLSVANTSLLKVGGTPGLPAAFPVNVVPMNFFDDVQTAVQVVRAINDATGFDGVVARPNGANEVIVTKANVVNKSKPYLFVADAWGEATPREMFPIEDRATNTLQPNQYSGKTLFSVQMGTVDYDAGDAPDGMGVPPQNAYPTKNGHDPALHMYGGSVFLGERVDRDPDNEMGISDDLDGEGYEVIIDPALVSGLQFVPRVGVAPETSGDLVVDDLIDVTVTATGSTAVDGEFLTIGSTLFELDPDADGVTPGSVSVAVNGADTEAVIATTMSAAINGASIAGVNAVAVGDVITITRSSADVVNDNSATGFSAAAARSNIGDKETFTIDDVILEFHDTTAGSSVELEHIAIPFTPTDDANAVAASIVQAILDADIRMNLNPIARDGGRVELTGDDADGVTGENGGDIGFFNPYVGTVIEVNASAYGMLDAWIDFNRDGDWHDEFEQIVYSQQLTAGINTLNIQAPLPPESLDGLTFARFRFSDVGGLQATGLTVNGEVEDYEIEIVGGRPPEANNDPTGVADGFATTEELPLPQTPFNPSLLINDVDADNNDIKVHSYDSFSAMGATVVVDQNWKSLGSGSGTFTYDPTLAGLPTQALAAGEIAFDTFTYTLIEEIDVPNDGYGFVSQTPATVTITLTGVNDAPTVSNVAVSAVEDGGPVNGNFVGNDVDNGATLTYHIVNDLGANQGSVVNNSDGTFTFDPGSDFQNLPLGETQDVVFTYKANDTLADSPVDGVVTITVTGINDSPLAVDDNYIVDQDVETVEGAPGVLANDIDDDIDGSAPDDVLTVTMLASNDLVGSPPTMTIPTIRDAELTLNEDGSFTYDPRESEILKALDVGDDPINDSVLYTMTDLQGEISIATLTFTVHGVNDAPIANPDSYTTRNDLILDVGPTGLLLNDSDPDDNDDPFVSEFIDSVAGETMNGFSTEGAVVTLDADGGFSYDPSFSTSLLALARTETLDDFFTYEISDGDLQATALVTVTVSGTNKAPVVPGITVGTDEDTLLPEDASRNVLDGVTDPDVEDVTPRVSSFDATSALGATVTVDTNIGGGMFTYDPTNAPLIQEFDAGDSTPQDTFNYVVTDGLDGFTTGTVTINLTGLNDPPVAVDDTINVDGNLKPLAPRDTTISIDLLANDIDVDASSSVAAVEITAGPVPAEATIVLDDDPLSSTYGHVTFTPPTPEFSGNVTFQYQITDDQGVTSAEATVSVEVNDEPVAVDDSSQVFQDVANTPTEIDVLANDDDEDGTLDSTSIKITVLPSHGTIVDVLGDGSVVEYPVEYRPDVGYLGADSFEYTVQDNDGAVSDAATVTLDVIPDPFPWHNRGNGLDVNADGFVSSIDALLVILELNENGSYELLPPTSGNSPPPYYDVNEDGDVAPSDAIQIINFLNANANGESGEGEDTFVPAPAVPVVEELSSQPAIQILESARSDSGFTDLRDMRGSGLSTVRGEVLEDLLAEMAEDLNEAHADGLLNDIALDEFFG